MMKKTFYALVLPCVLAYLGVCIYLYAAQRSYLYYPTPSAPLPGATGHVVPSGDENLLVWSRKGSGSKVLIYFGGNGENVVSTFEPLAAALPGHTLYLVNYRGYGGSSGQPTEAGLFRDSLAVYDWVRQRHGEVAVLGRSLGTGVAVYLATQRKLSRVVLVTPYDSIESLAERRFPILPVAWLMRDRYDSISRVPQIAEPILAVVAERDEVIPRIHSDNLIAGFAKNQVKVTVIPHARHNFTTALPAYVAALRGFLGE